MQNEENGKGKGLLVGILTGAAVGSIITLLFAPKSGKKLREDITAKSQDFIDDADRYIERVKDKTSQLINGSKKKYEELVDETKEKVNSLLGEAERLLTEVKGRTGNVAHHGKVKTVKK